MNRFEGVLIGTDSFHKGEAVLLHHLEEVFVEMEEEPEVVLEQSEKASVGIFYDCDLGMYGIEPFENRAVFLESGQPLGKNRRYYLGRDTAIYLKQREFAILLG